MKKSIKYVTILLFIIIAMFLLVGCGTETPLDYEEPTKNSESVVFDVQEGRLLGYFGDEPAISLPDSVFEITSASFDNKNNDIERIYIGENVSKIEEDAFHGMSNLESVEVAERNNYYSSSGNFLAAKDGSILFVFGTEKFDSAVFDYADSVGARAFCEDGFKIVFGDAVLYFSGAIGEEFQTSTWNCPLERVELFGINVNMRTNFVGNHALTLQYAENSLLITDYTHGVGDTYIISENGVWEQHNNEILDPENCNDPIIAVSVDSDGKFIFICKPRKYIFTGSIGDLLVYSSGREEIYSMEGKLVFDSERPQYAVEKTVVLSEKYTENQLMDEFDAMNSFHVHFEPQCKYESIDELFDKNKNEYGMFEWIE